MALEHGYKAIKRQGKNYFEMDLNKETAEYVYKIIAVKELLEYPELYMQGFGYNILTNTKNNNNSKSSTKNDIEKLNLGGMTVKVDETDGAHPETLDKKITEIKSMNTNQEKFILAQITGKYKKFKDGNIISFTLQENLYDHYVVLMDSKKEKGIALKSLKNKEDVLLKVIK
ncbi:MAG: hypothetical protein IPO01_17765 [Chitinophagaceae bacterium]|nr:hypothetical protein [Chitinophagaceae bacterium]